MAQQEMATQQQQQFLSIPGFGSASGAMAAAAAMSAGGTPASRNPGSYGTPGSVGGLPFGMSPHALSSAALHPLHFGQSPPTQHVSAMGFAAGMQHAAAAAAAAAVQLPALNPQFASSPAGPGLNLAAGFVGRQNFAANQPGAFAGPASAHGGGWGGSQGPASTFDSLTRARPSHLRSVGEEGNGEMEHDGGGRAAAPVRAARGGWGRRKRSMEQLSDHEAWDDELLFEADGVGGGGGVASTSGSGGGLSVGAAGTAPGATTSGVGGGWPSKGAHVAGTPPTSAGMFSQSVPNWHSAGMMGHQPPQLQFQAQAANAAAMANNFQALAQFGSPQQQAHLAQQFQHQVGLNPMSSQQRQLAVQMQLQQHQQQMYGGSPQREIRGSHPRSDENLATEGVDARPFRHGRRANRRTVASARASKTRETLDRRTHISVARHVPRSRRARRKARRAPPVNPPTTRLRTRRHPPRRPRRRPRRIRQPRLPQQLIQLVVFRAPFDVRIRTCLDRRRGSDGVSSSSAYLVVREGDDRGRRRQFSGVSASARARPPAGCSLGDAARLP